MYPRMKLRPFRALWGTIDATDGLLALSPHRKLDTLLPALRKLGYVGIEMAYSHALSIGPDRLRQMLDENDLKVGFIIFSDGPVAPGDENMIFGGPIAGYKKTAVPGDTNKSRVVQAHMDVFKEQVEGIHRHFPDHFEFINSHSCKDYFTVDMADTFFDAALSFAPDVMHEGHRKRFLHSPWVARDFLPKFPQLKFVADLSHYTCVAETGPDDPDLNAVIDALAPQVHHVHCRVGYDHGPQVSDPRMDDWIRYTEGFERWWDAIWESQIKRGDPFSTFTPEHGPPTYQQCDNSGTPLGDIWDINHWIALRRQARFAELYGSKNTSKLIPTINIRIMDTSSLSNAPDEERDGVDPWDAFEPSEPAQLARIERLKAEALLPCYRNREEEAGEEVDIPDDGEDGESSQLHQEDQSLAFYLWHDKISDASKDENEAASKIYCDRLERFQDSCALLWSEVDNALKCLDRMEAEQTNVTLKASSLHRRCSDLLGEQKRLLNVVEKIEQPMRCFDELHRLEVLFGVAAAANVYTGNDRVSRVDSLRETNLSIGDRLIPGSEDFKRELGCIDTCILFLDEHSQFRDALTYSKKFRDLQTVVLKRSCASVKKELDAATAEICKEVARFLYPQAKQHSASSESELDVGRSASLSDDTMLYVKIRALGRSLKPLISEIERRVHHREFAEMLLSLHRSFYESRRKVLLPIANDRLTKLRSELGGQIAALARDSCEYLRVLCSDEYRLFHEFFTPTATRREGGDQIDPTFEVMTKLMRQLCAEVYAMLRSRIIQQVDIDVLCELVQLFKDVQSSVRIARGDVVEPATYVGRTASSNDRVLSGDSLVVFDTFVKRMLADTQERLVYRAGVYVEKHIRSFRPSRADIEYPKKVRSCENESDATKEADRATTSAAVAADSSATGVPDIYPTLKHSILCMSKIYRRVNDGVFQNIAHSCVRACIDSLRKASTSIMESEKSGSATLDGTLFLVKQLLIFREQIAPFDVAFISTEKNLNVSASKLLGDLARIVEAGWSGGNPIGGSARSTDGFMGRLFSFRNNPFFGAMRTNITVETRTLDSKKNLEEELKLACKSLIEEVLFFVAKPVVVLTLRLESEASLCPARGIVTAPAGVKGGEVATESDVVGDSDGANLTHHSAMTMDDSSALFKATMQEDVAYLVFATNKFGPQAVLGTRNKAGQSLKDLAKSRNRKRAMACLEEIEMAMLNESSSDAKSTASSRNIDSNRIFKAVVQEDVDVLQIAIVKHGWHALQSIRNKAGQGIEDLAKVRSKAKVMELIDGFRGGGGDVSLVDDAASKGAQHDDVRRENTVRTLVDTAAVFDEKYRRACTKVRLYIGDEDTEATLLAPIKEKMRESCSFIEKMLSSGLGYDESQVSQILGSLRQIRRSIDGKYSSSDPAPSLGAAVGEL
eukprot:g1035.t1